MKHLFKNIIVLALVLSSAISTVPSSAQATNNDPVTQPVPNEYCVDGGELDVHKAAKAYTDGLLSYSVATNTTNTVVTFTLYNRTNCYFPLSLSSYKMYDNVLSHQEFYSGSGLIQAKGTTTVSVNLPSCMAQIDAWYGLHPEQLLDSNPYAYPNVPAVIASGFIYNNGTGYVDASGDFCKKIVTTPNPTVTISASPTTVAYNSSTTLTWTSTNATSCSASKGWSGSKATSSSEVQYNLTYYKYFEITCMGPGGTASSEVKVAVTEKIETPEENTKPVITLQGANPVNVYIGSTFTDPGATAIDKEDGDITSKIVKTGSVDTNLVGSYLITYNVVDSKGLSATEVSRTVNVLEVVNPTQNKGKISFCLILANDQNVIATSSLGLPQGKFGIDLSSTTSNISSTTIYSKIWETSSFAPNKKIILSTNDSDCVTFENLPFGTYLYSPLNNNGSTWSPAVYNDQDTQPVNNIFDFFPYGNTNTNSDGFIIIGDNRSERTLYMVSKYNPSAQCVLPVVTSPLTSNVVVGNAFTYTLTASTTTDVLGVSTSTLPSWLSFSTTTKVLTGTPTQTGSYNVELTSNNTCGLVSKTLVITVSPATLGGGGGGGGGGPTSDLEVKKIADKSTVAIGEIITYTISLVNKGPNNTTGVTLTDLIPGTLTIVSSTSTVGTYATTTGIWTIGDLLNNNATTTLTIVVKVNSGTDGQKITNTATVSSSQSDPVGTNNSSSVDVNVNPVPSSGGGGVGGGGGNGPIVGSFGGGNGPIVASTTTQTTPNSCYYLYDYLRKDFNNNPVEVKKLQVFLRDLEGFTTVQITGIYDDQTIVALDAFQERYKSDILTPWGHTEATSYTYILTKKKVNEIYCKMAFPVTPQQQTEIDSYRAFIQGLIDSGVTLPEGNNGTPSSPSNPSNPIIDGQVGKNGSSTPGLQGTLAGYSSSTQKMLSNLTANVISSGKKLWGSLLGLFGIELAGTDNTVANSKLGFGWLNVILILAIILLSYLWYREYRNNKNIEEINKEIDL